MSFTYGFYNALNHDRLYNAIELSSIFDGIILDGVYQTIGTAMMVTATSGMTVNVGIGRAWFNHTWSLNDAILPIILSDGTPILGRIDAVVLKIDTRKAYRTNEITVLEGTPASSPVKPSMDSGIEGLYYYPLAYITIAADVTEVTQADIENAVGTSACPFVTGVLQGMNIDALIAQWQAQWNAWLNSVPAEFNSYVQLQKAEILAEHLAYTRYIQSFENGMNEWEDAQRREFTNWFNGIRVILDGNVAGHLQNEIDDLNEREFTHYYGLVNKVTDIVDNGGSKTITETSDEAVCVTTFSTVDGNKVITTVITPEEGELKYIQTVTIASTNTGKQITETYTSEAKEET